MFTAISSYFDSYNPLWYREEQAAAFNTLLFFTDGEVTYRLNGQTYRFAKNDIVYFPAGTMRFSMQEPNTAHEKFAVLFAVGEGGTEDVPLLAERRVRHARLRGIDYIKQRFSALHQHWVGRQPYYSFLCMGLLAELLVLVNRELDAQQVSVKKKSAVGKAQTYIAAHYRETITIGDLAELTGRTPNHLIRMFRESTGLTPIDYMHRLRIQTAKELLLLQNMAAADIADYLGYCDPSYFHKMFRKLTGTTPAAYVRGEIEVNAKG